MHSVDRRPRTNCSTYFLSDLFLQQTLLFVKAIKHFRPKTVSYENVPGLVLEDFKGYLQYVVSSLLEMGYQVRVRVLTSSSHGDPQKRRRLFLVAARSDCMLPAMPSPTHGPGLLPIKTCKDALQMFEKHDPSSSKSSGTVKIGDTIVFNHVIPGSKHEKDTDFELIEDEPSRTSEFLLYHIYLFLNLYYCLLFVG